jgi:glycosyltransferase involved in cell wall biosynthesis
MKVLLIDGAGMSPPYDLSLVKGLETSGAVVRLVIPSAVRRDWENPDAAIVRNSSPLTRKLQRAAKAGQYALLLEGLREVVNEWKPDIVHMQWLALPILDGRFIGAMKGRVPLVHTLHNTSLFHGSAGGVQGWGLRSALTKFERVIVHSEFSRNAALKLGMVQEQSLRVIPHGAFDHYGILGAGTSREKRPVNLLFAGSIKPYKGLDVLIEALSTLAAESPKGSWHLTIAGSAGGSVDALRKVLSDNNLDRQVTWCLRHQSERELGQLLAAAHVVVLPYREIDQSGVLLAAVGVGRAVVATRVGAFQELIRNEQHGLLVSPEDPVALGHALARIVVDDDLRAYCESQMQVLSAGALSWSNVGRMTTKIYDELFGA